ncbi:hypothetical protein IEO21_04914 [Rhodonia placenta]|uniref:Uncharacterized protein n=1 Tax=Rhodonia placenta TaxID=104341 RepID=A0A8H7P2V5_9APHY|nr:hypothetical protein IEO21_04914 [Postia placenta]
MSTFPIAEAQLVALFMQSVTYGIHAVTFSVCIWKLIDKLRSGKGHVNWPWIFVAVALFTIGTVDVSFNLYHNLSAFILYKGPGGAEEEFMAFSSWINVMRSVWYNLGIVISDAALMYRCWIICNRRWFIMIPSIILWCTTFASIVVYMYYMGVTEVDSTIGIIIHHIWQVSRHTSEFFTTGNRLARANRIFVESALLYTVSVLITFIATLAGSNSLYGLSDVTLELSGIVFDLIIIRISGGTATEQTYAFTQSSERPAALRIIANGAAADDLTQYSRSAARWKNRGTPAGLMEEVELEKMTHSLSRAGSDV